MLCREGGGNKRVRYDLSVCCVFHRQSEIKRGSRLGDRREKCIPREEGPGVFSHFGAMLKEFWASMEKEAIWIAISRAISELFL